MGYDDAFIVKDVTPEPEYGVVVPTLTEPLTARPLEGAVCPAEE